MIGRWSNGLNPIYFAKMILFLNEICKPLMTKTTRVNLRGHQNHVHGLAYSLVGWFKNLRVSGTIYYARSIRIPIY